ncbi:hypothetical protein [Streptomyces sp. V4I23]|uniref:hypothetical protein n=1 Tax=Streptomyces sp. V4I23 TaxID=3042282 RepID=UPI0027D90C48|nr:hypothetical protein [Streptomyces sp. V4I23]
MDTTIKVDSRTRDRLAAVARAQGTTMRSLLAEFAESTLTPEELKERAERTRAFLETEFGHRVDEAESGDLRARMRAAQAAHRDALRAAGIGDIA